MTKEAVLKQIKNFIITSSNEQDITLDLIKDFLRKQQQPVYRKTEADSPELIAKIIKGYSQKIYDIGEYGFVFTQSYKKLKHEDTLVCESRLGELRASKQKARESLGSLRSLEEQRDKIESQLRELEGKLGYESNLIIRSDKRKRFIAISEVKSELEKINKKILVFSNIGNEINTLEDRLKKLKSNEGLGVISNNDLYILAENFKEIDLGKMRALYEISYNFGKNSDAAFALSQIQNLENKDNSRNWLLIAARLGHPEALENAEIRLIIENEIREIDDFVTPAVLSSVFSTLLKELKRTENKAELTNVRAKHKNFIKNQKVKQGKEEKLPRSNSFAEEQTAEAEYKSIIERVQDEILKREIGKYSIDEKDLGDNIEHYKKLGFSKEEVKDMMKKTYSVLKNPTDLCDESRNKAVIADGRIRPRASTADIHEITIHNIARQHNSYQENMSQEKSKVSLLQLFKKTEKKSGKEDFLQILTNNAQLGRYPESYWALSEIYGKGIGGVADVDLDKSVKYLYEAALLGHAEALSQTGVQDFFNRLGEELESAQSLFNNALDVLIDEEFSKQTTKVESKEPDGKIGNPEGHRAGVVGSKKCVIL